MRKSALPQVFKSLSFTSAYEDSVLKGMAFIKSSGYKDFDVKQCIRYSCMKKQVSAVVQSFAVGSYLGVFTGSKEHGSVEHLTQKIKYCWDSEYWGAVGVRSFPLPFLATFCNCCPGLFQQSWTFVTVLLQYRIELLNKFLSCFHFVVLVC